MTSLTMKPGGEVTLPPKVCARYGLTPTTPIRVIETRTSLLLVSLTDSPMHAELARELEAWQELSHATWEAFPFDEITERAKPKRTRRTR
jgi:hypothetical protein